MRLPLADLLAFIIYKKEISMTESDDWICLKQINLRFYGIITKHVIISAK